MTISPNIKKHLISGVVTFISAFLLFVGANIQHIDVANFDYFAFNSIMFAGARAAVKAVWESLGPKLIS